MSESQHRAAGVAPDAPITPAATVAELYRDYPATAVVFAEHGIDLCCGGARTVEFAARAHGVDLARLLGELRHAAGKASP